MSEGKETKGISAQCPNCIYKTLVNKIIKEAGLGVNQRGIEIVNCEECGYWR